MNTRTLITAATWLATAAAAFSGCAAEETVDSPSSSPSNVGPVTGNQTAGGTAVGNTTTISTAAAVTQTNAVGSTGTTGAGATTTTGGAAGPVTSAAGPVTSAAGPVTSAGAANNTSAGSSGGGGCDALSATGTAPLIDDFADDDHVIAPNEGRVGYWYEYGDTDGTQTTAPLEGVDGSGGVLTASGSGFTEYVGFGVDLNNGAGEPCEYDASAQTGVQFDITSDVAVTFQVALPGTKSDSGHYGIAVPASPAGTTFKAAFSALAQPDWGTATDWDATQILQLQWQITDPTEAFDITLDNVTFY